MRKDNGSKPCLKSKRNLEEMLVRNFFKNFILFSTLSSSISPKITGGTLARIRINQLPGLRLKRIPSFLLLPFLLKLDMPQRPGHVLPVGWMGLQASDLV